MPINKGLRQSAEYISVPLDECSFLGIPWYPRLPQLYSDVHLIDPGWVITLPNLGWLSATSLVSDNAEVKSRVIYHDLATRSDPCSLQHHAIIAVGSVSQIALLHAASLADRSILSLEM